MTSTFTEEKIKYKDFLSSLFCSSAIIMFSVLCLINNQSLDIYSMMYLLKTVIPASVCFWFLGKIIGTILDKYNKNISTKKKIADNKAYEIPSIFGGGEVPSADNENEADSIL